MNISPLDSPASYTGMMFGWSSAAAWRPSRRKRSRKFWLPTSVLESTFSATGRSRDNCVAR